MAHCYDDAVVISTESGLRDILPNITPNAFGDLTTHVVIMPIRSSSEDRTHGVIVIGLNTRIEFTKPYKDYINTMRGLFATGLASVKLHNEQMARAQYLAALNKRKNDELQVLLKKKTEELRSAELKMSTAFDCCPTGIWIANENLEIVFLNPAYYQITGLHPDAALSGWIDRVHPDDMERVKDVYSKCRQQRSKADFRVLTDDVNPDGTPAFRWVESIAGPQYDSLGQVCGTIMDITLRKEREEYQVRRAEDALERKRQQEYFIDMVCTTPFYGSLL
jgi:PAS domain S-box-containing protein